jgi:hypothetical protein
VQQIATNTILGNDTGGTANVKALTASEAKVLLALNNVDNTSDLNKPISSNTQTALDAKVAGPASAVNNQIAVFDGTTGKIIKDSGFTIETSVPAGAVFTDTGEDNIIEEVQAEGVALAITAKAVNVTRLGFRSRDWRCRCVLLYNHDLPTPIGQARKHHTPQSKR